VSTKTRREFPELCPAPYASIFIPVCSSKAFIGASNNAKAFLFALMQQHNGINNGRLHLVKKWLAKKGWPSASQNAKWRDELTQRGLIAQTRQGGLNANCSWYALTWLPMNNATGLDFSINTYNEHYRGKWAKCELPETPRRKPPQKNRDAPSDQRNSAVPTNGTVTPLTMPTSGTENALLSNSTVPTSGNNSLSPLPVIKQRIRQRLRKPIVGKAGRSGIPNRLRQPEAKA
jgi:hypothetical protein